MSAIQWAKSVRCDWPDCTQQAEVELGENWPGRVMPPGWVDLSPGLSLTGVYGHRLAEFCPGHAAASLRDLAVAFPFPGVDVSRETSPDRGQS